MNQYYATFITGFEDVIRTALKRELKDATVDLLLDGAVIFRTRASGDAIKGLRFFNNSFYLYQQYTPRSDDPIRDMLLHALNNRRLEQDIACSVPRWPTTFRIMTSRENHPVAADRALLARLEARLTRIHHLRANRSNPDIEFWFLARREGIGVFGLRLTRHRDYAKTLDRGELRPELAHILCLLSEPAKTDIFLDPFCGSGAIPLERARSFPYRHIYAGDIDRANVEKVSAKARKLGGAITVAQMDATALSTIADNTIDRIVTDPPWGLYKGKSIDIPHLYTAMLKEFCRVTKQGAIMIVAVADKDLFESILVAYAHELHVVNRFNTLISGKKAGVYKLRKMAP